MLTDIPPTSDTLDPAGPAGQLPCGQTARRMAAEFVVAGPDHGRDGADQRGVGSRRSTAGRAYRFRRNRTPPDAGQRPQAACHEDVEQQQACRRLDVPVDVAQPEYVDARMTLRPARVAVVFDGGELWHYWARLAIYAASQVWGGAGFILIPHRDGEVAPCMLQAAVAYDPDHVMLLRVTIRHMELAQPGVQPLRLNGQLVCGADRRELVAQPGAPVIEDQNGKKARGAVAAVCSPYRTQENGGEWTYDVTALNVDKPGGRSLTPISELDGLPGGSRLAAPADWGGPLGVAVAARCGSLAEPVPAGPPQMDAKERMDLISWLISYGSRGTPPYSAAWHPAAAVPVRPQDLDTVFDWGRHGLTDIHRGFGSRRPALLVAGDEAADFALALAWDRMYGRSAWIPSEWQPDEDVNTSEMASLRMELGDFGLDPDQPEGKGDVRLTTTSLGPEALNGLAEVLNSPVTSGPDEPVRVTVEDPRFSSDSVRTLAVASQFDHQFTVPALKDDGGTVMVTPSPAPLVEDPELAGAHGLRWHVDLELLDSVMARGRGLDGRALLAPTENVDLTRVRSGRDGISFEAGRLDLVPAGTAPMSRLARPRLREPGLAEWVRLLAGQSGLTFELSPAGKRAETLRQLWGSRGDFVDSVTGQLLPVLRAFQVSDTKTSDAYPGSEGVVLLNGIREGFLHFDGMLKYAGENVGTVALRRGLDALLARGFVSRGLILDCTTCGRPAFNPLRALAQVNQCPRCGTGNELTQERWRDPIGEPTWHYDLHPVARDLLAEHGEVPLLLSRHLRLTARRYDDIPEMELRVTSGNPVAEADLIAVADDQVIVAEGRSVNTLGSARQARRSAAKRVKLASVLRADQIVLATTQPGWSDSSVNEIRSAVTGRQWLAELRPAVRLVSGLGSEHVKDLRLDLESGATSKWE